MTRHCDVRFRHGFTLIELVVMIGVILLLVGLLLSIGVSVAAGAESRDARQILKLLDQAVGEWELSASRAPTWGPDGTPAGISYDLQDTDEPDVQLTQLLARMQRTPRVRQILTKITADNLLQEDNGGGVELTVLDPWGLAVYLIHAGRLPDPQHFAADASATIENDGTIRTPHEQTYGSAVNRRLLFVSAGPDGLFGDLDPASPSYDPDAAADNVYSYEPGS